MKLTHPEKLWLKIVGLLALAVFGIAVSQALFAKLAPPPLADTKSLEMLMAGQTLPAPELQKEAVFLGQKLKVPPTFLANENFTVLGESVATAPKRIEIDLTHQKVYAFEGDRKIFEFIVSTGKWAPTPTGTFHIWAKVRSQLMSGGSQVLGTYYYLPNVPFVMFFYNQEIGKMRGFSLHGTYWHDNFGHPMSHGCINMKIADAAILYNWADPPVTNPKAWSTLATAESPGTPVVIYGEAPKE